jgi:putative hemolysin
MKKGIIALAAVAILSGAPIQAAAPNPATVQFLYQTCKDEMAASLMRFCLGYIMGVGQLMAVNATFGNNFALCVLPAGGVPTGAAMIEAFLKWAQKHPESRSQRNVLGVALALRETWPCPARDSEGLERSELEREPSKSG